MLLRLTIASHIHHSVLGRSINGDFRRLHRMSLIACHHRAAEWRHKEIELAAHELLQYLDKKTRLTTARRTRRPKG
jgi:hypothetical protein